jgi:acetoacetyl-CoA synthetase
MSQQEPEILWTPSESDVENAGLTHFMRWLATERGRDFAGDPDALWRWSVEEIEEFWAAIWDYFQIISDAPYKQVLDRRVMPGARWFEGSAVNYAEHVLRNSTDEWPAIVVADETATTSEISWSQLTRDVAALAATLRGMGVTKGDRVCGYLPNAPEAVVGLLATASIGAVWAVCAPDFGLSGVIDRFAQLEPKILIGVDGYTYGGKVHVRRDELGRLRAALPTVEHTILVPRAPQPRAASDAAPQSGAASDVTPWADAIAREAPLEFERVPYDHALWVLFSSGTTGLPKGIVHTHIGILVEQLKSVGLGLDLRPGDRWYIYSSTSWMVFNALLSSLLRGVTIVLYDGSPGYPDLLQNWRIAAAGRATTFGCGSAYLAACEKAGVRPAEQFDLSSLRTLIATGSVLPPSTWNWVYQVLDPRVRLDSSSGGTDVCSGFIGGNVLKPVTKGELTGPYLGVRAEAWNAAGEPVIDEVGELVIREPMPSMPVRFWNDPDGERYRNAYFEMYPGFWRHGDWVRATERGTMTIEGRSDSTLNKAGVRMGSADIYAVVEPLEGVADSLVVGVDFPDSEYYMPLFVVCAQGRDLDDGLRAEIINAIRKELSPRHVPDEIVAAPAVPRTRTGKKLEVPVKRILAGKPLDEAVSLGSVDDPDAVRWYVRFAESRATA